MKSMTGYGEANGVISGTNYQIQIKSVNNRFLDTNIRSPRSLFFLEQKIKTMVRDKVSRGKLEIYVNTELSDDVEYEILINRALLSKFVEECRSISLASELDFEIDLVSILKLPEMMSIKSKTVPDEVLSESILELFSQALDVFNKMREIEGEALKNDIETRLETLERYLHEIEKCSVETESIYREKLLKKFAKH